MLFALAACGTSEDTSCDPQQYHLTFQTADTQPNEYVDTDAPGDLAVGGTERFTLVMLDDCGSAGVDNRVGISSGDESIATVTGTGATFDVRGVAPGFVDVYGVDELAMSAQLGVHVRAIDSVRLVADEDGVPGAFFIGIPQVKVKLLAQGNWLVDRGLTITGDIPQGSAWNVLDTESAAAGDHALTVTVGGVGWPVTATIVDHIDDIAAGVPMPGSPLRAEKVCFFAHTGGVLVAGVPWTFDFEPGSGRVDQPNCVTVWPSSTQETSTTVTAHALGMSVSVPVSFPR